MKPSRFLFAFFLALAFCAAIPAARATPVDAVNFAETTFVSSGSISYPTGMAWAPDGSGRLFVICKGGEVRVVQHNAAANTGSVVSTPWTTFSPIVTAGECGLIGMCFDPGFLTNRYVYFFVTVSTTVQQIIRMTDDPLTNTGSNATLIVNNLPTKGGNHNGGGLAVGPDGRLYFSVGENTNTLLAPNLSSLGGKVGRANRSTGAALNDNPYNDGAGSNNDLVWALGFRNPFTLTFQPGTGKLWLNVVGSSTTSLTKGYEQSFVVPRGANGGWNLYENSQPAGITYLPPAISYRIGVSLATALDPAGAVRSNGTVTFTTSAFHPLRKGAKVTIAGVTDTSFNGTFYVTARLSDTQFTISQAGADATSGGGTATTANIGDSITGGCFYDSTAFPAEYRGNFFFGDYGGGRVMRVTLDANDEPVTVDNFATSIGSHVDSTIGPDGALYSLRHLATGSIKRIAATSTAQNLIVQPTDFPVMEGGSAVFTVRLAAAPESDVTVTVTKTGGDADIALSGGASLTFTPTNWYQYQSVVLTAAEDADRTVGSATFQVSAPGLASYTVTAREVENDEPRLVLSKNLITLTEGNSTTFTVSLSEAPASNTTVTVGRSSGDSSVSVTGGSSLTFTPANYATPQTVTVAALADADSVTGTADVSVSMAGDPDRVVDVTATDNGSATPVITSTAPLTAVVNSPYQYTVTATGNPVPTFSLLTKPTGMTIGSSSGVISWTPSAPGTYPVTVQASNGYGTAPTQSFNIVASVDAAPQANISQPLAGSVISGTGAEFFGNGVDDLGTTQAEFYVDGVLAYTDVNTEGHYHFNSGHTLFDTTQWSNGPHTLRMRVTDTAGQTGQSEVQVFFANGAARWKTERFTLSEQSNASISGDLADPDSDGLVNLFEYGLNVDPKGNTVTGRPTVAQQSISGVPYLTLTFTRVKWASDITYMVEAADSAGGLWTSIDPLLAQNQVSVQEDTPSAGLQTITVRDVAPATGSSRMMRLRVTK